MASCDVVRPRQMLFGLFCVGTDTVPVNLWILVINARLEWKGSHLLAYACEVSHEVSQILSGLWESHFFVLACEGVNWDHQVFLLFEHSNYNSHNSYNNYKVGIYTYVGTGNIYFKCVEKHVGAERRDQIICLIPHTRHSKLACIVGQTVRA
jgi:hypothetical protein